MTTLQLLASLFAIHYTVAPEHPTLDTPVTLDIELTYPRGYHPETGGLSYALSQQGSPLPPPFLVLGEMALPPTAMADGTARQHLSYTLQPQQIGTLPLLLAVTFTDDSDSRTVYASPSHISVSAAAPPLPPEQWPTEILQPWTSPTPVEPSPELLQSEQRQLADPARPAALAALLRQHAVPWIQILLALISTLALTLLHRSPKKIAPTSIPLWARKSPSARARASLRALQRRDNARTLTPKVFYSSVEAILRRYLQDTFPGLSPSLTAEELTALFPRHSTLHQLLAICTTGKFSSPAGDSAQQRLDTLTLAQKLLDE